MKKISISSKKQVVIILLIFIIPSIVFLISYNVLSVNEFNTRISETNKNTVSLYQQKLESQLTNIDKFMVDLIANDSDYAQLIYKTDSVDAYIASDNVLKKYKTIINMYPMIGGMYIYSKDNLIFKKAYNEPYGYELKVELEQYVEKLIDDEKNGYSKEWFVKEIGNQYFLFRILGVRGTYTICLVRLDNIENLENINQDNVGFVLYSSAVGEPLTMMDKVKEEGISLKGQTASFYISGAKNKYFIVQNKLDFAGINMVYLMPYHGLIYNLNKLQLLLIISTILILLLIPVCYRLLQHSYFRPLERLVETMNRIKDGKLDAKMEDAYNISEFQQVSSTFNEMMDQIKVLKISAYEKELEAQRAQLQYLQIQIRPHFFLNCLKSLYGMAEEEKHKEIQEVILALSAHYRYMFRDSFTVVPLSRELEGVNNYINLQKMSKSYEIQCNIDADAEIWDFEIPPMSILTFVENSVKHGIRMNEILRIFIKARLLRSEEGSYVNLTISDNGKGFTEQRLRKLNKLEEKNYMGEHIGIYNVKRRLSLIYDNQCSISFSNQANGACVEIFIPYSNKR